MIALTLADIAKNGILASITLTLSLTAQCERILRVCSTSKNKSNWFEGIYNKNFSLFLKIYGR